MKRFDFGETAVYICCSEQLVTGGNIDIEGELSDTGVGKPDIPCGFCPVIQHIYGGAFDLGIGVFQMFQEGIIENPAAGCLRIGSGLFQTPYRGFVQYIQQDISRFPHLIQIFCVITDSQQKSGVIFIFVQNGENSCQFFRGRRMDIDGVYSQPQHCCNSRGGRVAQKFCCLAEESRFDRQEIHAVVCAGFQSIIFGHISVRICKIVFLHLYDSR